MSVTWLRLRGYTCCASQNALVDTCDQAANRRAHLDGAALGRTAISAQRPRSTHSHILVEILIILSHSVRMSHGALYDKYRRGDAVVEP